MQKFMINRLSDTAAVVARALMLSRRRAMAMAQWLRQLYTPNIRVSWNLAATDCGAFPAPGSSMKAISWKLLDNGDIKELQLALQHQILESHWSPRRVGLAFLVLKWDALQCPA